MAGWSRVNNTGQGLATFIGHRIMEIAGSVSDYQGGGILSLKEVAASVR